MGEEFDACGWLSPDGEFIPCEPMDHWNVAYELITEKKVIKDLNNYSGIAPMDKLIEHGWIQISFLTLVGYGYIFMHNYKFGTELQKQFLRKFIENHKDDIGSHGWLDLHDIGVIDWDEYKQYTKDIPDYSIKDVEE